MKNKKIFLMLLLVFALFMFAACNTNDNVTPDVPDTTNNGTGDGTGGTDGTGGMDDTNNGTGLTTDGGINNNTNQ
ncbi:MAG: hypothetical protein K0Q48_1043 [Bacillota bacterium]|jgi:predicted small secreted protein|nr:hypothetical protein [Bacillota bacterium]